VSVPVRFEASLVPLRKLINVFSGTVSTTVYTTRSKCTVNPRVVGPNQRDSDSVTLYIRIWILSLDSGSRSRKENEEKMCFIIPVYLL
jgi:hypothetical protein